MTYSSHTHHSFGWALWHEQHAAVGGDTEHPCLWRGAVVKLDLQPVAKLADRLDLIGGSKYTEEVAFCRGRAADLQVGDESEHYSPKILLVLIVNLNNNRYLEDNYNR